MHHITQFRLFVCFPPILSLFLIHLMWNGLRLYLSVWNRYNDRIKMWRSLMLIGYHYEIVTVEWRQIDILSFHFCILINHPEEAYVRKSNCLTHCPYSLKENGVTISVYFVCFVQLPLLFLSLTLFKRLHKQTQQ